MSLHPPHPSIYERILGYGNEGTGKTRSWMDIARYSSKTGSDAMFYAIDTEISAIPRMLTGDAFKGLTNIHHEPAGDYTELVGAIKTLSEKVRPQDWLIIDRADVMWEAAQDHYVDLRYGRSLGEQWLHWATTTGGDMSKGRLMEGDTDWGTINKLYRELITPIARLQGHVFATAAAKKVGDRDAANIKETYARFGLRPEGQKSLGHLFHTVLLMSRVKDEWMVTTVKDRERDEIAGQRVKSFTLDYLKAVAGWGL